MLVAASGFALAGLGLAQKLLPNGKIFWFLEMPSRGFFSSFVYKDGAGASLDLTLFVTCGLAAWYFLRGLRRARKVQPCRSLRISGNLYRHCRPRKLHPGCHACHARFSLHRDRRLPDSSTRDAQPDPQTDRRDNAADHFRLFPKNRTRSLAFTRGVETTQPRSDQRGQCAGDAPDSDECLARHAQGLWAKGAGAGSFGFLGFRSTSNVTPRSTIHPTVGECFGNTLTTISWSSRSSLG